MRLLKLMMLAAVALMAVVSCTPKKETSKKEAPKVLVLYYSLTSNTQTVAQEIATRLNADI